MFDDVAYVARFNIVLLLLILRLISTSPRHPSAISYDVSYMKDCMRVASSVQAFCIQ